MNYEIFHNNSRISVFVFKYWLSRDLELSTYYQCSAPNQLSYGRMLRYDLDFRYIVNLHP
jgi:hypothetical protein